MTLCKHCRVRIEMIETTGDQVWMHVEQSGMPSMPRALYQATRPSPGRTGDSETEASSRFGKTNTSAGPKGIDLNQP